MNNEVMFNIINNECLNRIPYHRSKRFIYDENGIRWCRVSLWNVSNDLISSIDFANVDDANKYIEWLENFYNE
jgi:hypothetical protein